MTVDIINNKAARLLKDLELLQLISVHKTDKCSEESVLNNIRAGLEEVRLFNESKLKTTPAKDFLHEL